MNTKRFLFSLVATLALAVTPSWACTNLIVGKAASVDGSVICTYNCDGYGFAGSM
ncbi:MAG: C69 family dipeptidase [Muribaculaceae bacterium]|nr:C69 family dipeptidase [Muribaculaceae bacterium]